MFCVTFNQNQDFFHSQPKRYNNFEKHSASSFSAFRNYFSRVSDFGWR
jgi:hypothetical protein